MPVAPNVHTSVPPPAQGATVPRAPEELTPAWLTSCLRHAGALGAASVIGFGAERIGVGRGFAGRLYRLRLRYDAVEPGAPATMIGKFIAVHDTTVAMMHAIGGYLREVRFYRELAGKAEIPMPRCYLAHYDLEARTFLLLLEDLAPSEAVDIATGFSVEQAKVMLEHAARMHARYWGRTEGLEWLALDENVVQTLRERYLATIDDFVVRFGARFPELARIARKMAWVFQGDEFLRELRGSPMTLTHGDLHVENVLFPTAAGGRLAVVDWQSAILTRYGAGDVTRIVAMGLRPELRRAHEDELLRHYHAVLRAHGVRGYSLRKLRARYRQEMAAQVLIAVVAFGSLDFDVDRGEMLTELFGGRLNQALVDLRFEALLTRMVLLIWPLRPFYHLYLALRRRWVSAEPRLLPPA
jgi:hypothetical protein